MLIYIVIFIFISYSYIYYIFSYSLLYFPIVIFISFIIYKSNIKIHGIKLLTLKITLDDRFLSSYSS